MYVLSPESPDASLRDLIPGQEIIHLSRADEMRGRDPGVLLLSVDLPADQVVAAITQAAAASSEASWLPVLVDRAPDDGRARAVPISIGWPTPPEQVVRWAGRQEDAAVLELRHVLARVARSRHDINNPLTSAMAEAQLALMDVTDPVVRQSLETIEEQLRRIRDLVADLRVLRPPMDGAGR